MSSYPCEPTFLVSTVNVLSNDSETFLLTVGAVCFTVHRLRQERKKKQTKNYRFPRADDIEKERSKHFNKLQLDRSKVHVVCTDEDWDEVLPKVSQDGMQWS